MPFDGEFDSMVLMQALLAERVRADRCETKVAEWRKRLQELVEEMAPIQ